MAADYRVLAVPTTPLSAMQTILNAQAAEGYDLHDHLFGADGTHHVAGGVRPETIQNVDVVDPATGKHVKAQITTNMIVMIFRKP